MVRYDILPDDHKSPRNCLEGTSSQGHTVRIDVETSEVSRCEPGM